MTAPTQRPASNSEARKRAHHDAVEDVIASHRRDAWDTAMHGVECSCGASDPFDFKWSESDYADHLARAIRAHVAAGGVL